LYTVSQKHKIILNLKFILYCIFLQRISLCLFKFWNPCIQKLKKILKVNLNLFSIIILNIIIIIIFFFKIIVIDIWLLKLYNCEFWENKLFFVTFFGFEFENFWVDHLQYIYFLVEFIFIHIFDTLDNIYFYTVFEDWNIFINIFYYLIFIYFIKIYFINSYLGLQLSFLDL